MFGFGRLSTYDYFAHVERALAKRFSDAGVELVTHVVNVAPTASIRRRAVRLTELVAATAPDDGSHVHLLGHSTGGLDARLVASPSATLPTAKENVAWVSRLRSVTTLSTPHFGTPLASFFATVSGQRMLYAVSALTFVALSLGAPPLTAASAVVMAVGRIDAALGVELRVLDRATDALLRILEPATSHALREYLDGIRRDQGAMIQLTPEAMDLFQAGVEDRAGVRYQCTCVMAPAPSVRGLARELGGAWRALSSALFAILYGITSRYDERYPCAAPNPTKETERVLMAAFGQMPGERANDGVVPVLSQVWGTIVWAGYADHLDVLGHFAGERAKASSSWFRRQSGPRARVVTNLEVGADTNRPLFDVDVEARVTPDPNADAVHVDWLTSGAGFDERAFDAMMDALARGMLSGA